MTPIKNNRGILHTDRAKKVFIPWAAVPLGLAAEVPAFHTVQSDFILTVLNDKIGRSPDWKNYDFY